MKHCPCSHLYCISSPIETKYAFSGSLCRIREFQTFDGSRYCLTVFSLANYKHLHFPHDEYHKLISELYALLSTRAILPNVQKSKINALSIKPILFDTAFKIVFGGNYLIIEQVTAFGLVNTSPFDKIDVFSINENHLTCDPELDICTCQTCPVFKRLVDFQAAAQTDYENINGNTILWWGIFSKP